MEEPIRMADCRRALGAFFDAHSREVFDLYACPNAFRKPRRIAVLALPTPYAWVDIDEADVDTFDPQPGVLIRTSDERHQGIWRFADYLPPREAEGYSKALAYSFGADKNGWSVTKHLRIPFTYNHKPQYDRPTVKLLRADMSPRRRKPLALPREERRELRRQPLMHVVEPKHADAAEVLQTYRSKLHPRVRALITARRAYTEERDRSKCIYEIIADLHRVGAKPREIGSVLWVNAYFISKHGQNLDRLNAEINRVLAKLGGAS